MVQGAKSALTVVAACACAGIITGVVTKTGVGLKMGSVLVGIANGNLLLTLMFTMITSLILGIGVPTTANYVITSTIAAPAILMIKDAGGVAVVPILAAHLFVFYFGIIADVTPPVCLAAVAAAGVAKSEPMKTGLQATRLAIAAFLIPYIFVMEPQLIMINPTIFVIVKIFTALIGVVCVSVALTGYFKTNLNIIERALVLIAGLLTIEQRTWTDVIGIAIIVGVWIYQTIKAKKEDKGQILKKVKL
jgi:TRAP-type uncharacterized transport system fused permease subunit